MPAAGAFDALSGVSRSQCDGNQVTLFTTDVTATLGELTRMAGEGTVKFEELHVRRATLEDVFLKITGRGLRD